MIKTAIRSIRTGDSRLLIADARRWRIERQATGEAVSTTNS